MTFLHLSTYSWYRLTHCQTNTSKCMKICNNWTKKNFHQKSKPGPPICIFKSHFKILQLKSKHYFLAIFLNKASHYLYSFYTFCMSDLYQIGNRERLKASNITLEDPNLISCKLGVFS